MRSGGTASSGSDGARPRCPARWPPTTIGQIAVLVDEGDLALPQNAVDLQGTALRFSSTSGGYAVSRVDLPLEAGAGTRVTLTDDASTRVSLEFSFPFYGKTYSEVFVNSDGNVTFTEKDDASTARDVGRLVNGPPRARALLADLDPGSRGSVSVLSARDHLTVGWQGVPQYGQADANTFQVALWADGRLDFVYGQALSASIDEGVVGIAPGGAEGGLTAVDFATAAQAFGGAGALAESFRAENDLDTVAVARKFYATHPDDYAQLVVYTSRTLVPEEAFAYLAPGPERRGRHRPRAIQPQRRVRERGSAGNVHHDGRAHQVSR
jgi:hypothetical protein